MLELGVTRLNARREQGSRAQRATILAEYVLAHQEERTAEGEQLALAVVREAAKADPDYPAERIGIDEATRNGFWAGLKRDGYAFANGQIVADVHEEELPAPPVHGARTVGGKASRLRLR